MVKQAIAVLMSLSLAACVSAGGARPQAAPVTDPAVMADYVQRLPIGSRVKVERTSGGSLTGTLMRADETVLIIQKRTDPPLTPLTIPLQDVTRVTVEGNSSTAVKIWAGVGIALTCLYVFSAVLIASASESAR